MSYNLLKGKRGIISGALDNTSIAWKVAERAHKEGALFTLTNAPVAMRLGSIDQLAENTGATIIPADATSIEDIENLFTQSEEVLGGKIDFILHSIGMSPNVRKEKDYIDLNYEWFLKSIDVSALSLHKMVQTGMKLGSINDHASIVALSYIAAQRTFPSYGDMAEAKSVLESLCRSLGYHLGKSNKIRVNSISQSPTMTTAGSGVSGIDSFINYAESMSPLGNASAEECAGYCISLFSDLTRMVTMQNLMHDGGFSSVGVSREIMADFADVKQKL